MPKNLRGGKGYKKGKKGGGGEVTRQLLFRDDGQYYAKVTKMTGNRCLMAIIDSESLNSSDNKVHIEVQCHIRGKMRKRVWINRDDVILICSREFDAGKYDVIHKYNNDEVRALQKYGEIKSKIMSTTNDDDDDNIEFNDYSDNEFDEEVIAPSLPSRSEMKENFLSNSSDNEDVGVNIDNI